MGRRQRARAQAKGSGTAAPAAPRPWGVVVGLALVFVVKATIAWQLRDHPLLAADAGLDTGSYVQLAHRVTGGDLALGPGLYYLSPLYIYFLAALFSISDSLTFVRLVQAALGTAAVGCIFAAARDWYGRRAGWVAAAVAAWTGVLTFYEIVVLQSALDPFLTAAGLACLASAFTAPELSRRKVGLAGLLFGLQILNRPNVGVAVVGVGLGLLVVRRFRAAALLAAGVLVALAPVVVRNAVVSRQFALASSQGGLNFFIGNNPEATGQYVAVPGVRANIEGQAEDTRRVAEKATGRPLSDAEVSAYFTSRAGRWLRQHPSAGARLFARKLALAFNARHQWLDFSFPYYAHDAGTLLWLLACGPWLLVPLGLAGLIAGAPAEHNRLYWVWLSFLPWYAVGLAAFFVAERYRLPMFVPLSIGAGAALAQFPRWTPRARMVAAGAGLAGAVITAWPFAVPDGRFEERLRLSKVLMNRGDYFGATAELQSAFALRPDDTVTEFNLGMALATAGQAEAGIAHVRRAVEAGVPVDGARYALANLLLRTGDSDGAVRLLRTYSPLPTDSAESCYHVGVLALEARAPAVADRFLRRALELRPGWPEAEQALAEAAAAQFGPRR